MKKGNAHAVKAQEDQTYNSINIKNNPQETTLLILNTNLQTMTSKDTKRLAKDQVQHK